MDDPLRLIAEDTGVFLYGEAIAAGYRNSEIAAKRRSGEWHRVRHGAYCFGEAWRLLDDVERHRILTSAVLRQTPGPVALSHTTALIFHGIVVWGADLSVVHLTRLGRGAGRHERDVVHHQGLCVADSDLVEVAGCRVTSPERALIESATVLDVESSLVSVNDALHRDLVLPGELHRVFTGLNHWPNSRRIHLTLHHMDGRVASAGESRSMHMFFQQGLPRPVPQREVHDETGRLIAIVDFDWEQFNLFGEFDGKDKYLRLIKPGETPGDAVFREKRREDEVRRVTGKSFVRWTWGDLYHPMQTAARIRAMMRRG